jgi:hypothetical protein
MQKEKKRKKDQPLKLGWSRAPWPLEKPQVCELGAIHVSGLFLKKILKVCLACPTKFQWSLIIEKLDWFISDQKNLFSTQKNTLTL